MDHYSSWLFRSRGRIARWPWKYVPFNKLKTYIFIYSLITFLKLFKGSCFHLNQMFTRSKTQTSSWTCQVSHVGSRYLCHCCHVYPNSSFDDQRKYHKLILVDYKHNIFNFLYVFGWIEPGWGPDRLREDKRSTCSSTSSPAKTQNPGFSFLFFFLIHFFFRF